MSEQDLIDRTKPSRLPYVQLLRKIYNLSRGSRAFPATYQGTVYDDVPAHGSLAGIHFPSVGKGYLIVFCRRKNPFLPYRLFACFLFDVT